MSLIKCNECQKEISKNAVKCPHCGEPLKEKRKRSSVKQIFYIIILVFIYNAIISPLLDKNEADNNRKEQEKLNTLINQNNSNSFNSNKDHYMNKIKQLITEKKYLTALKEARKYKHVNNPELTKLYNEARKKSNANAEAILYAKARKIPASNYSGNIAIYQQLINLNPSKQLYKTKKEHYKKKQINEKNHRLKKHGKAPTNESNYIYEVSTFLKLTAKNPDSMKIESCGKVLYNEKSGWIAKCLYSGKNSFNATTRDIKWFVISHGRVINTKPPNHWK